MGTFFYHSFYGITSRFWSNQVEEEVFIILPPVWLLNVGSDLSIDNIVWLSLADRKISSQDILSVILVPFQNSDDLYSCMEALKRPLTIQRKFLR